MSNNENPIQPSDLIKGISRKDASLIDEALTFQLPSEDVISVSPDIPSFVPKIHDALNTNRTELIRLIDDKDNQRSLGDILEDADTIVRHQNTVNKMAKKG